MYDQVETCAKILTPFIEKTKGLSKSKRKKEFINQFHYWEEYVSALRHRSAKQIAVSLIAQKHCISERSIRTAIRNTRELRTTYRPSSGQNDLKALTEKCPVCGIEYINSTDPKMPTCSPKCDIVLQFQKKLTPRSPPSQDGPI